MELNPFLPALLFPGRRSFLLLGCPEATRNCSFVLRKPHLPAPMFPETTPIPVPLLLPAPEATRTYSQVSLKPLITAWDPRFSGIRSYVLLGFLKVTPTCYQVSRKPLLPAPQFPGSRGISSSGKLLEGSPLHPCRGQTSSIKHSNVYSKVKIVSFFIYKKAPGTSTEAPRSPPLLVQVVP